MADGEVHSAVVTTSQPDNVDSQSERAVPDDNLALHSAPSTVDFYAAMSVYWEITDGVHEPASTADDEHSEHSDYETLDAQSVEPQLPIMTVPDYISLLRDDQVEETDIVHTDHLLEVACVTEIQLSFSNDSEMQQV